MNSHLQFASRPDILVVDDTRENLRLLATMLSEAGYKVRKAINGAIALRAVEVAKPDLILLDIRMPGIDGYEVCQRIKANPQTAEIPIIFLSALDDVFDKVKAFEVGAVDYITKPFELPEVLVRIKTQLTLAQQHQRLLAQQKQLSEQNAQLQLLLTVTRAIGEASDFQTALEITLRQACEKIAWDFGEVWLPNGQATVFERGEGWYASDRDLEAFRHQSKLTTFATHKEFFREICQTQKPCWLENVSLEPSNVFQRNQLAREVGLRACLGVPILFEGQVMAILVLLKREASPPQPRAIELVTSLAKQLSFFIDRKRSETALREHQQQLAAMAEHIPGCVYRGVVHPNGSMKLLYISEGEHELSGLDPHKLMGESERLLEKMSPQERGEFYQALKAVAQAQKPVTQEYPIASPSGEVKWVRNSARYTLSENGDIMVDGLAIDISDCLQRSFASPIAAEERMRILEKAISTSGKDRSQ